MVHHKAPHREWEPDAAHAQMYEDEEIPEPETFDDDYAHRARAAAEGRTAADARRERGLARLDAALDQLNELLGGSDGKA